MWTPGAVDFFRILNEQARRGGDGMAGYSPHVLPQTSYCTVWHVFRYNCQLAE